MPLQQKNYRRGLRKASALASHTAATTPANLYLLTTARTGIIRKVQWANRAPADGNLQIGTGTAPFVQAIPDIPMIHGQGDSLAEDMLPEVEFTANITAQVTGAAGIGASPADVQIRIEVEEYGS